jgi:prevent-host-death family protein
MTTVGAYEAKTHLPRLLDEVERGGTVTITKHGREIAKLVPSTRRASDPAQVIDDIRAARVGVRRGRGSVRRMIEDGRR